MKDKIVKDLMVPLSEYATVSEEASLYEAILALEKAQEEFVQTRYPHRAVLVYDEKKRIVGKVSQLDIIRALEPKYEAAGISKSFPRFGLSQQFQKTLLEQLRLWNKPMETACSKARHIKVKQFMYTPAEGEYIAVNASMDEAINQLIMGHHQSLLVTETDEIVGVLRLTDVFMEIVQVIKATAI